MKKMQGEREVVVYNKFSPKVILRSIPGWPSNFFLPSLEPSDFGLFHVPQSELDMKKVVRYLKTLPSTTAADLS